MTYINAFVLSCTDRVERLSTSFPTMTGHTSVDSLVWPLDSLSLTEKPRLTLLERQEIARERYRAARQVCPPLPYGWPRPHCAHARPQRQEENAAALAAHIRPKPTLPAEYVRDETNPRADPPVLWYGLPVEPARLAAYVTARASAAPHRITILHEHAARLLSAACSARVRIVRPVSTSSRELSLVVAIRSSAHPDTGDDARVADAVRAELGVPSDRPCLWHFDAMAYVWVEEVRRAAPCCYICGD